MEMFKLTPGNIYQTEEGTLVYIYRELTLQESIKAGLVGRLLCPDHGTTGEPCAWNPDGTFRGRLNGLGTVSVLFVPRLSIVAPYSQPQES